MPLRPARLSLVLGYANAEMDTVGDTQRQTALVVLTIATEHTVPNDVRYVAVHLAATGVVLQYRREF